MESFEPAGESFLFDDRVFFVFFAVVAVLMAAVLGLFVWMTVRNLRVLRRAGTGGRPAASLADRLQELDDLRRRGLISQAEHAMARQRTLTSS